MIADAEEVDETTTSGKEYRRKADKGRHAVLVVAENEQEKKIVDENMAKAAQLEREIVLDRVGSDTRTLTVLDVETAAARLSRGQPVSQATRQKCEKDDYALYGIRLGIRVTSVDGKKGVIVAANMDKEDGCNKFTIRWGQERDGGKIEQYSTHEDLRDADRGQGVVSLQDDENKFGTFLRALLCMVLTHVHDFIAHNDELKRVYHCVALDGDEREDIMAVRKDAWENTKGAAAADPLNPIELSFLASDTDLIEELEKEGSCLKMMGLDSVDSTVTSLVYGEYTFHPTHTSFVTHFVRGAQAAWSLGRLINMESCMAPISVNELPDGIVVCPLESDRTIYKKDAEHAEVYGLATRALLARARLLGTGSHHWLSHYPLYRLLLSISRPVALGAIAATSENTGKVCPTRRHIDAYTRITRLSETREKDLDIFKCIGSGYEPVAQSQKALTEIHENGLARHGNGSKTDQGRMFGPSDITADGAFERMEHMVMRN